MALQTWTKENDRLKQENKLLTQLTIAGGREPNPDDAPYRPAPVPNPGKPPWPGYPNPQKLAGNPSFDINESSSTRKIRGIRNLGEKGSAGEKDAAVEMLKRLGGPQLPQVNLPGSGLMIAGRPNYSGIPNTRDLRIRDAMQIKDPLLRLEALKIIAREA